MCRRKWRSVAEAFGNLSFPSAFNESHVLAELRSSLDASGVELWTILIDGGDITHPETGDS
jgi:hypothetical protein